MQIFEENIKSGHSAPQNDPPSQGVPIIELTEGQLDALYEEWLQSRYEQYYWENNNG